MKIEFAGVNLHYLIHVRDVAREDPSIAAPMLGMSSELAALLAQVPSEYLAKIAQVKVPLLAARGDPMWWSRLFKALIDENPDEIESILEAVTLSVLS